MKSCFGCGSDWEPRWKESDLAILRIEDEDRDVCPDCYEEICRQHSVRFPLRSMMPISKEQLIKEIDKLTIEGIDRLDDPFYKLELLLIAYIDDVDILAAIDRFNDKVT